MRHTLGLVCSTLLLAAAADAAEWKRPFYFVMMADPQIPKVLGPFDSEKLFPVAVRHANRLKPEKTVILGDMIQANAGSFSLSLARDHFNRYRAIADSLSMPVKLIAGNHDVLNTPTAAAYDFYRQNFDSLWYSFTHMDNLFIVLESNIIKHPDNLPATLAAQMAWLRATLAKADSIGYDNTVIMLHHSLCIKSVDEPESYENLPVARRKEMLKLFHDHKVRAVFSGHHHGNAYVRDGDLELITVSSVGVQEESDLPGFNIMRMDAKGLTHKYYTYDQMPAFVEADAPGLTLTAPNGGESWPKGSDRSITWSSASMAPEVKLEYFAEGSWHAIAAKAPNSGSFKWRVPEIAAATLASKIRITTLASGVADQSDADFTISGPSTVFRSPSLQPGTGHLRFPRASSNRVSIRAPSGRVILEGANLSGWDGRDSHGNPVPGGLYFATVRSGSERFDFRILSY